MGASFFSALKTLSGKHKQAFFDLVCVGLSIHSRYPAKLALASFRDGLIQSVPEMGVLFTLVYEKKLCTWKELIEWKRQYETREGGISVTSSASPKITAQLSPDSCEQSTDVGLCVTHQGKIYKRFLTTDIKKLLV